MTEYTSNNYTQPKAAIFNRFLTDLQRLPLIIHLVLAFMLVIFVWNLPILGYNLTGLAWVIPSAFSILILSRNIDKVTFPYILWLPWVLLLICYLTLLDSTLLDSRVNPYQRTVQMISPLLVGMAVSTWRPTETDLAAFLATCRRLGYLILVIVGLMTGVLLTGVLPAATALAAQAITATLLCTFFAASFANSRKREDLLLWGLVALVPIIAVTRTAIAVSLLTFPLTFGPLRILHRVVALILVAMLGLVVFNSERIQNKMFSSGAGSVQDISEQNDNFATSGRSYIWNLMIMEVEDEYLTGHGTGRGETFTYNITGDTGYPHNDWLLTLYDYGLLGIVVYAVCILLAIRHAFKQARQCSDSNIRVLMLTGAGGFITFVLMMYTDNIMAYASYFGNLHYIFLGLAYGAIQARREKQSYFFLQ